MLWVISYWLVPTEVPAQKLTAHLGGKRCEAESHPSYTTPNTKSYVPHQLDVRDFQQHRESAQRLADLHS
jgi:hypothetical protein